MKLLACTACLYCLSIAPPLRAEAAEIEVRWDAPAECPTGAVVQALVGRALGPRPLAAAPLIAHGRVERRRDAFHLTLSLEGGSHRADRELSATSCKQLAITAAWLIAIALDPEAEPPTPSEADETGSSRAATAFETRETNSDRGEQSKPAQVGSDARASSPAAGSSDRAATRARASSRAVASDELVAPGEGERAGVSGGAAAGVAGYGLPGAQPMLSAFLGLSLGHVYLAASITGLLPRTQGLPNDAEARYWSLEAGLTACPRWGKRLRAGPCTALTAVRTHGTGENLASGSHAEVVSWLLGSLGLGLFWRLDERIELIGTVDVGTALTPRPRFNVGGLGSVTEGALVTASASLGVSFRAR